MLACCVRLVLCLLCTLLCTVSVHGYRAGEQVLLLDDGGVHRAYYCLFLVNTTHVSQLRALATSCTLEVQDQLCQLEINNTLNIIPWFFASPDPLGEVIQPVATVTDGCSCVSGELTAPSYAHFTLDVDESASNITAAAVELGGWLPAAPASRFNLTVVYVWRAPPSPWKPPVWHISPEDYFLFAVAGAFGLVLLGAAGRWLLHRLNPASYTQVP